MIAGLKDYHPKPEITSDEIVSDVLDFLVKEDANKNTARMDGFS